MVVPIYFSVASNRKFHLSELSNKNALLTCKSILMNIRYSLVAQMVMNLPEMQKKESESVSPSGMFHSL